MLAARAMSSRVPIAFPSLACTYDSRSPASGGWALTRHTPGLAPSDTDATGSRSRVRMDSNDGRRPP
jgi:hypothetical protein